MKWTLTLLTGVLAFTLISCRQPGAISGAEAVFSAADSAEYLDRISSQPDITEADAFEGIMLLLERKGKMTFAEAVKLLTDRKIVSQNWDFQAKRAMTRGKVAYIFYQACGMKGGLTLALAGPSRRYCLRELQFRGYMAAGLPYNRVTGMEYVAILARADELRQTGKVSSVMVQEEGVE